MADDLLNALAAAGDRGALRCHGFEVNTAQPLVPTGQGKQCALPHGFRYFRTRLASQKLNSIFNMKFARELLQSRALGAVANNFALNLRMAWRDRCQRS